MKLEKIKEQKRISLSCPNCNYYGLMDIKAKTKVEKRINYYVCCPKCGQNFKQVGRRFNFWRHLKKKHKLKHEEVRIMQKELPHKDGEIKLKEKGNVLEIGDVTFVKTEDGDLGFLKQAEKGKEEDKPN